jgi:hypothetical protein
MASRLPGSHRFGTPVRRAVDMAGGDAPMFEAPLGHKLRQEQADLNHLFIDLVTRAHGEMPGDEVAGGVLGLRREWVVTLTHMRHRKRREIAECSFALYGLHLHDAHFWSAVRLHHIPGDYAVSECALSAELQQRLGQFSLTALMHAWYVACSNEYAARLMFGIPAAGIGRIAALPVTLLEKVARRSPALLQARLTANKRFWPDLIACVDHGSKQQRFAAKLLGAQLIAASSVVLH